jgi:hypothetical protein
MGLISLAMNLIFIVGLVFVTISLTQAYNNNNNNNKEYTITKPQIIYRYVPKSYLDEQFNPEPFSKTFNDMFNNSKS